MPTFTTLSGVTKTVHPSLDLSRVVGLDREGRVVVDDFDGFGPAPAPVGGYASHPFLFGLTLCCTASDKGTEGGNVCRACYGADPDADSGDYLFRWPGGYGDEFDPRLDLLDVRPTAREHLTPALLQRLMEATS